MSDVWRELEERLKQKAKTFAQIDYLRNLDLDKAVEHDLDPSQLCAINNKWMLSKWVRLEDVQKLIEEIKQKYVLIEKEKAKKLCDLWVSHIEPLDHQAENPYYFYLVLTEEEKNEFSQILKELLRKNEG